MFNSIFMALALDFYIIYHVDTFSHFLGGLTIAYCVYQIISLLQKKSWLVIEKNIIRVGIIVMSVTTVAVFWEFYEFISDQFFGTLMQPSLADTMKDLCIGMVGALVFCLIFIRKQKQTIPPREEVYIVNSQKQLVNSFVESNTQQPE